METLNFKFMKDWPLGQEEKDQRANVSLLSPFVFLLLVGLIWILGFKNTENVEKVHAYGGELSTFCA